MEDIKKDAGLVSFCGLYCGACGKYLKGKCPGCAGNKKASWCAVRKCCLEKGYKSCADCEDFQDVMECGKFNNFFSKFFALVFGSDRKAAIERIRRTGVEGFASEMAEKRAQSIKRNRKNGRAA